MRSFRQRPLYLRYHWLEGELPLPDGLHELRGRVLLAVGPQLPQVVPRLLVLEPSVPELLDQGLPELSLEYPGPQVLRAVERVVDVLEVVLLRVLEPQPLLQAVLVDLPEVAGDLALVHLHLVDELRGVPPEEHQLVDLDEPDVRVRVVHPQELLEPEPVGREVVEQEREGLRDRVVPQVPVLRGMVLPGVPEVPRVASLVEERVVVPPAPDRPDHQPDVLRHLHGPPEAPRGLLRPLLGVYRDVLVLPGLDPHRPP